ncbi:restriction endonuclease subunit S [Pollutimonas harenae]|uniref:Restriction endonuclease subunit S n=1 Tax=Pollutimonas harenae TaxID=657015 RepID=A0A853GZ51_9BURK|nr:restriction endonuclease subunit S [Pollutimonas harenae]NYT85030.1 restriction endonuclease subunit S [Pollutimonas harenae]TEA72585.1 restriction endonuclease subunit S [Pollutimonas harenae]
MNNLLNEKLGSLVGAGGGKIHTGPFGSQLHASDYVPEGIPCIMPANMRNNRVDLSSIAFITEEDAKRLSKYIVKKNDIVYSRRGDVTQKALIREKEAGYFCGTGCLLLRPGKNFDARFLTYYLSTPKIQNWLISQAVGATMPNLNTGILSSIPFHGPKKAEQEKIADVLSAVDEKIELNDRINGELEAMAKTLYDYWFVQFDFPDAKGKPYKTSGGKMVYNPTLKRSIPTGWEDGKVLTVADLLGGGTPTKAKPEYWGGAIPFFTPSDSNRNIFSLETEDYITEEGLKNSSTRLFAKNTVFLTARGSVGRLALNAVPMAMNQSCYALSAKDGISHVFLFFLTKELIHHLEVKASGSVFNSIVSNDIELTSLALPKDRKVIASFAAIAEPIFSKIETLTNENRQLSSLRDWLLPMLMNGQVTVT